MEISFCELRAKEVVNVFNGQKLGNIIDMIIDTACARVLGIVVPNCRGGFNLFRSNTELFIPYHRIVKIGKDIILVDLNNISTQSTNTKPSKKAVKYAADNNYSKPYNNTNSGNTSQNTITTYSTDDTTNISNQYTQRNTDNMYNSMYTNTAYSDTDYSSDTNYDYPNSNPKTSRNCNDWY